MLYICCSMVFVIFMILLGIPIMYSFFAAIFLMVYLLGYSPSFLLSYGYDVINAVVLLCVPLYVCVGAIMSKSNIGAALVDFVDLFVGRIRGGLGIVAVVASAIFGSISGSAAATLTCIGSIMIPKMIDKGYPRGHVAALLTNACPLGLLIPPSASMIVYAWVSRQSILACFLATVLPGIVLVIMLSIVNVALLKNNENVIVKEKLAEKEFWIQVRTRGRFSIPAFIMPVTVLGGTYGGIFTPTEAAAVAVFYAIPVGWFVYKGLNYRILYETFVSTASTTGVVMIMCFGIMIFSRILVMQDLPGIITELLKKVSSNPYVVLLFVNILLLVLGMIMDDISAMLLTVPILVPITSAFGISPIHLAAIVGVNLGLGLITPPCAPMLYLGLRISGVNLSEIIGPTMKFILFAWVPTLICVTYFPRLSLWLPGVILGW